MLLDNPLNPDNRVEKEAASLGKAGHQVTVYCKRQEGLPFEEQREFYLVRRVFNFNLGTSVLIDKYLWAHLDLFHAIKESYDVYHCHDTETWPIGYILAQRDKGKFVCDSHEYFPEYLVEEMYNDKLKYQSAQLLALNRGEYIRYADAVVTVSDTIAELLYKEYNLNTIPTVLYNTRLYKDRPMDKYNLLREEFNIHNDCKIVLFQGNIDYSRGIESLIESISYVKANAILVIAGNCNDTYKNKLLDCAVSNKVLDRILFTGHLDNRKLLEYTASADILAYYPRAVVKNMLYTLPNKFFDYIFAAKPMICRDFDIYKKFIEDYGIGYTCHSEKDIAQKIDTILSDSELYRSKVDNCIAAQQKLSWELQEQKLLKLYQGLCNKEGRDELL